MKTSIRLTAEAVKALGWLKGQVGGFNLSKAVCQMLISTAESKRVGKALIVACVLALSACGNGNTDTTPKTAKMVVTAPAPVHGLDFWLYTQDQTPLQFQSGLFGSARYDAEAKGWHVAVVSETPINDLAILNMPESYSVLIIKAVDLKGRDVAGFVWKQI